MANLDKAVLAIFSPATDAATREQAQRYCDEARAAPGFWRVCFEHFARSSHLQVQFWCLQTLVPSADSLRTLATLAPAERNALRTELLWPWLHSKLNADVQPAVANKLSLLLVNLLRLGYEGEAPEWSAPFTELLELSGRSEAHVDFVLRVLYTFDTEVVSEEFMVAANVKAANTALKHRMRQNDNAKIAQWFYTILTTPAMSQRVDTLRSVFLCVALFAVWVDVGLFANDTFLQAVFAFIVERPQVGGEACDCLAAILKKKMDAELKLKLLDGLQIPARLDQIWADQGALARCSFLEALGKLYNRVGEEFLDSYAMLRFPPTKPSQSAALPPVTAERMALPALVWPKVEVLVRTCLVFLSCDSHLASTAVQTFLSEWTGVAKKALKAEDGGHTVTTEQLRPALQQLWGVIVERIAYPAWFQPEQSCDLPEGDEADDRHLQFMEYRKGLLKLMVRVVHVDEPLAFEAVLRKALSLGPQPTVQQLECIATVFHTLGEAVQKPALGPEDPLGRTFDCLTQYVNHPHWTVNLAYLELYVRYGAAACAVRPAPQLLVSLLNAFLHSHGLGSPEPRLARRAAALLSRFVKANKTGLAAFHEEFYKAMEAILPLKPETLTEDAMPLYEVMGHLGQTFEDTAAKKRYLQIVVAPLLTELKRIRDANVRNNQACASWCASLIEALGSVSRPYSKQSAKATTEEWTAVSAGVFECLDTQIEMLGVNKHCLRAKVIFFCRRMLEILAEQFMPSLDRLLPFLYRDADSSNVLELTTVCHHVVCMLKTLAGPFVGQRVAAAFRHAYDCFTKMEDTSAELVRAKADLGIAMLQLLKESASRAPREVLRLLLDGPEKDDLARFTIAAVSSTELRLRAPSATFWRQLTTFLGKKDCGFDAAVFGRLPVADLVEALVQGGFTAAPDDLRDAAVKDDLPVEVFLALRPLTTESGAMAGASQHLVSLISASMSRLPPEYQRIAKKAEHDALAILAVKRPDPTKKVA